MLTSRSLLVTTLLACSTISAAHAQPAADAPAERDPDTALAISLAGTGVSTALLGAAAITYATTRNDSTTGALVAVGGAGLLVAPSLGHTYGRGTLLTTGMTLRLVSLGTAALSLAVMMRDEELTCYSCSGASDGDVTLGTVGLVASAGLFVAGVAHDVATARGETRRANRGRLAPVLAPTVVSSVDGPAPGLGLVGSF